MMKKHTQKWAWPAAAAVVFSITVGCNSAEEKQTEEQPETVVVEEVDVVEMEPEAYWLVDEHQINNIPTTSKGSKQKSNSAAKEEGNAENKTAEKHTTETATTADDHYDVATQEQLDAAFSEVEYEALTEVDVEEFIIPLDETQTLISYNSKGKYKDSVQVISDANGNVEQIVFAHKKHKDVYDVENGMSAKEVKKLRKEMKHMVKHGKVFLYTDSSNVMYVLDAKDVDGNEITEVEVDQMSVEAIIWKDKKHHKKDKK